MHSAWLEQAGGDWTRTTNATAILDHDGRFLVCEDETDEELIAEKIAAESGKYANKYGGRIEISDVPVFDELTDEAESLAKGDFPCRIRYSSQFDSVKLKDRTVQYHVGYQYILVGGDPPKPGFCVDESGFLIFDLELWEQCKAKVERAERKRIENPTVNAATMFNVANRLATNIGIGRVKGFLVEHLMVWIAAHDQLQGRRATNREIKWLAKAWSKNAEGHKKHYRRWVADEVLEALEARFRKVVKFPTTD